MRRKNLFNFLALPQTGAIGLGLSAFVAILVFAVGGIVIGKTAYISDHVGLTTQSRQTQNVLTSLLARARHVLDSGEVSYLQTQVLTYGHWTPLLNKGICTSEEYQWGHSCPDATFPALTPDPEYPGFDSAVAFIHDKTLGTYQLVVKVRNRSTGEFEQYDQRFMPSRAGGVGVLRVQSNSSTAALAYPNVQVTKQTWIPPSNCQCEQSTTGRSLGTTTRADGETVLAATSNPGTCPAGQEWVCHTPGYFDTSTTTYAPNFGTVDTRICNPSGNPTEWAMDETMLSDPDAPFSSCHNLHPSVLDWAFVADGPRITSGPAVPLGSTLLPSGTTQSFGGATITLVGNSSGGDNPTFAASNSTDTNRSHYLEGLGTLEQRTINKVADYINTPSDFQSPQVSILTFAGTVNNAVSCAAEAPCIVYLRQNVNFTQPVTGHIVVILDNPSSATAVNAQFDKIAIRGPMILRGKVGLVANSGKITASPGDTHGQWGEGGTLRILFDDPSRMPSVAMPNVIVARAAGSLGINWFVQNIQAMRKTAETRNNTRNGIAPDVISLHKTFLSSRRPFI